MVDILAALSASGVTVALSIHQPRLDIFQMLTHLLLLSGGGLMVFSGPARLAAAHFAALGHPPPPATNTADFILDVVIRLPPDQVQVRVLRVLCCAVMSFLPCSAPQHCGSIITVRSLPWIVVQMQRSASCR